MIKRGVFLGIVDIAAVDEESVRILLMRVDEDASAVEIDESVVHFDRGGFPPRRQLRRPRMLLAVMMILVSTSELNDVLRELRRSS